jgi:3-dehydroquinate dehydratase-1
MQLLGGHISKIAVMPKNVQDILTLLDATITMKNKDRDYPLITMAMGPLGLISRLSGELFGSACTFGAGRTASAPGQIPANDLRNVLNIFHKYFEAGRDI